MSAAVRHIRLKPFGPLAVEVGRFLAPHIRTADAIALFDEVNRRWPSLSFRDFYGAAVLAEALAATAKPEGSA